jgi:hypothetical protein
VYESTLAVEEIELVVECTPGTSDSGGVGKHAERAGDLGEITTWYIRRWLIADTEFKTCWAPIDEADCSLGLD